MQEKSRYHQDHLALAGTENQTREDGILDHFRRQKTGGPLCRPTMEVLELLGSEAALQLLTLEVELPVEYFSC